MIDRMGVPSSTMFKGTVGWNSAHSHHREPTPASISALPYLPRTVMLHLPAAVPEQRKREGQAGPGQARSEPPFGRMPGWAA